MIVTTTASVPGFEITATLGIVQGNTVRAKHIGRDFMAGIKGIVGGEIEGYTELLAEARNEAIDRMLAAAIHREADGVVNVRFVTSMVAQTMSEMLAYGTAVKLRAVPMPVE
ncbi:MAG: hypothetical protein DWQ31_18760 [Planctomycetota bacterium]|nr:MAG: hypothetical protein DWQ31_18760 [Planctomycetota bacterium]REJ95041.1 MAG: hypothetical protein DWQ35_07250 [Planctomycetota bacterium]REK25264.1 MAG: hypothetical protein DWQ42_11720 [Planctomycetota bacterium]REK40577.1 MAG: hypothetical protein DWQ46_16020 [Planctomycetota bacterium]